MAKILMQLDETQQYRKAIDNILYSMKHGVVNIENQSFYITIWWKANGASQFQQRLAFWIQDSRDTISKIEDLSRRVDHEQAEWVGVVRSHHYLAEKTPYEFILDNTSSKMSIWDSLKGWKNFGDFEIKLSLQDALGPLLPWDLRYPAKKVVTHYKGFTGYAAEDITTYGDFDAGLDLGWDKKDGFHFNPFAKGSTWKKESYTYLLGGGLGLIGGLSFHGPEYGTDGASVGSSIWGVDADYGRNISIFGLDRYIGFHLGANLGGRYGFKWDDGPELRWGPFDLGFDMDQPKDLPPPP